ncbi:MAG: hypothetical protein DDT30_02101 [Dehalococcoidia bacterium]|nr:hypothetical protein [Bacillota bacterium]
MISEYLCLIIFIVNNGSSQAVTISDESFFNPSLIVSAILSISRMHTKEEWSSWLIEIVAKGVLKQIEKNIVSL